MRDCHLKIWIGRSSQFEALRSKVLVEEGGEEVERYILE